MNSPRPLYRPLLAGLQTLVFDLLDAADDLGALESYCGGLLPGLGEVLEHLAAARWPTAPAARHPGGAAYLSLLNPLPGNHER